MNGASISNNYNSGRFLFLLLSCSLSKLNDFVWSKWRYFQQPAILSVTLTLTFRQSANSKVNFLKHDNVSHLRFKRWQRIVVFRNWWNSDKSSSGDGKMSESKFDQTKPSKKSLSRWKWYYAPLVMVSL